MLRARAAAAAVPVPGGASGAAAGSGAGASQIQPSESGESDADRDRDGAGTSAASSSSSSNPPGPSLLLYDEEVYRMNPDLYVDSNNSEDEEEVEDNNETADGRVDGASPKVCDAPEKEGEEQQKSLRFDSSFESGNLFKAVRVYGRENKLVTTGSSASMAWTVKPSSVAQEYDITLRKDLYTKGNIQWYYFKVETPDSGVTYPLRVRFNIVNMQKNDSLYNYGMKPAVYSQADAVRGIGWRHKGEDVTYFKNRLTYKKNGKKGTRITRNYYSLTFTYTFYGPDSVFFAHSYPYTYSRLQEFLVKIESDSKISKFAKRGLLCKTLAKNRCELLTITEPCDDPEVYAKRPAVVVSARVHPGETNSSFVMEGLIAFLISDHEDAKLLRSSFVFKLVPMLNPDGVIQGNYRCSLAGTDLNRRYIDPNPHFFPTVHALKEMIGSVCSRRPVVLNIDLHGHSKLKNSFSYGCDPTMSSGYATLIQELNNKSGGDEVIIPQKVRDRQVFVRLFPKLMSIISNRENDPIFDSSSSATLKKQSSKMSKLPSRDYSNQQLFSYVDCSFKIQPSKRGTGRVVSWRQFGIEASYTIEMSFCGPGDNKEVKVLQRIFAAEELAAAARSAANNSDDIDSGALGDTEDAVLRVDRSKFDKSELALIDSYSKATHYSIADFKKIGIDLCIAMKIMANISSSQPNVSKVDRKMLPSLIAMARSINVDPSPATDFPLAGGNEATADTSQKGGASTDGAPQVVMQQQQQQQRCLPEKYFRDANVDVTLPRLTAEAISKPLLVNSVFEEQSIKETATLYQTLMSKAGTSTISIIPSDESSLNDICVRMLIEGAVRKELEILDAKSRSRYSRAGALKATANSGIEGTNANNPDEAEWHIEIAGENDMESNEDAGSDSNPSDDNVPMSELMKNKTFKLLFKGGSVKSKLFANTSCTKVRRKSKSIDAGLMKLSAPTASRAARAEEPVQQQKAPKFMLPGAIQRLHEGRSVYSNGGNPPPVSPPNVMLSNAVPYGEPPVSPHQFSAVSAAIASLGPTAAQFLMAPAQAEKSTIKLHEFEFETIPTEKPPISTTTQRRATVFIRSRDARPTTSNATRRHSISSPSNPQLPMEESDDRSKVSSAHGRSTSERKDSEAPVLASRGKATRDQSTGKQLSLADRYERRLSNAHGHRGSSNPSSRRDTAFAIAIRLARGELPYAPPGAEDSAASQSSTAGGAPGAVDWRFRSAGGQQSSSQSPSTSAGPSRATSKQGSGDRGGDSAFSLPAIDSVKKRSATFA